MAKRPFKLLEFFAGGGLAHLGLSDDFECVLANDIDPMKCRAYRQNFPDTPLIEGDVGDLDPDEIPAADLAWASSPCQDLSLAGQRAGLSGARSGAFWGFWKTIEAQLAAGRAPRLIVIENVTGLLTSNDGEDFRCLISTITDRGYSVGAVVLDAAHFTPQSRPRVFVIAYQGRPPEVLTQASPHPIHHPTAIIRAVSRLSDSVRSRWVWWNLPDPPIRNHTLREVIETSPPPTIWRSPEAMDRLEEQMSPTHQRRLQTAREADELKAGAVYRRIRTENGEKRQRAEIRYDGLAGCLRTPAGGSSKQLLVITDKGEARLRPLMAREAARLMGCPDTYKLPSSETDGLKIMGDGVCVSVVRWLSGHLLSPLLTATEAELDA